MGKIVFSRPFHGDGTAAVRTWRSRRRRRVRELQPVAASAPGLFPRRPEAICDPASSLLNPRRSFLDLGFPLAVQPSPIGCRRQQSFPSPICCRCEDRDVEDACVSHGCSTLTVGSPLSSPFPCLISSPYAASTSIPGDLHVHLSFSLPLSLSPQLHSRTP